MYYKSYQNIRDAAWKVLLDCHIDRLPVDLNAVCKNLGVRVLSYAESARVIEQAHLYHAVRNTNGLAFCLGGTPVILFNETLELPEVMFTVAHELGHLILGHVAPGATTAGHQGPMWQASPEETAANRFAARLLVPACVLWGLDVRTPDAIMELCQVTRQAAEYRAGRMNRLRKRQRFLTSPLERALYRQFLPFISAGSACPPQAV